MSENGALRLDSLTFADDGDYTMLAQYSNLTVIKESTYKLRVDSAEVASQVVNGILGGSVYFYEFVPIQANPAIIWTFNNAIIAQRFPSGTPVCVGQYAGRCDLSENGTLRLDNLRFADDGDYTMLAQYPNSTVIKESTYTLRVYNVLSTPVLSSNVSADRLINGTHVSLDCDPGSQTVTTYTFYRNGKNICSEPHVTCRDSNLYFQPITESDSGSYTCTIQNPVNSNSSNTLHLSVSDILSNPVLSSNVSADLLINGTHVSLHCDPGSQTVTTYTFYCDGKNICTEPHVTCRDSNLYFQPITESDSGSYTCTIQNPVSTSNSNILQLSVSLPVSDMKLTSNISGLVWPGLDSVFLNCSARGSNVSYSWRLQGAPLPQDPQYHLTQNNSVLTISPILAKDNGTFTCTATNWINNETSNGVNFNLAHMLSTPVLSSNVSADRLINGTHVSLHCDAGSQTVITYTFYSEGKNICNEPHVTCRDSNLYFQPITESDSRSYTCTIQNPIGTSNSSTLHLSVSVPVSAVTLTSNASGPYIWAGEDSVSFLCLANGSAVTFLWKLNGQLLPQDPPYHVSGGDSPPHSNLLISPVSRNDAGPFTCEASNRLGSNTSNALSLNLAWNPEKSINCTVEPVGQYVKLGCSWSGGRPAANVSLIYRGETQIEIDNVTREVSAVGNFQGSNLTCLGDQLERTSQCTVTFVHPEAPGHNNDTITTSNVGETVVLTVILKPGMPAEFTWYHLNPGLVPIQTNRKVSVENTGFSSQLQIPDVTVEDAGEYVCTAKNFIGSQSFLFTVTVTVTVAEHGLSGGVIAGIVIGVLFGVILISIAAGFYILRRKKSSPGPVYENADVIPANIYERTMPALATEKSAATPESQYEQLAFQNKSIYNTLMPGPRN